MHRAFPARRVAVTATLGLAASLLTSIVTAAPASAEQVFERPASGVFSVLGHGWGHGHGLSQWGAQGAASLGVGADEITSTYYPGTAKAVLADAPIRVLLQADEGRDTQVYAAAGLKVTDVATGKSETLPAGPSRWRATVDAAGLHLSSLSGSTWTSYAIGTAGASPSPSPSPSPSASSSPSPSPSPSPAPAYAGPIRFAGPEVVRVAFPDGTSRDYRGAVQAVKTSSSALQTIDVLSLESYLLGVVPRESSSSWKPAALQAQAIAARSYSAYKRAHASGSFDICDTTQCQVFGGTRVYATDGSSIALEPASTTDAVHATAGVVRTYNGAPIFAEFSSSNGGWSTDGGTPYLVPRRDDWDGAVANPVHSWTASLKATDIERRYPSVGTLKRLRITVRDGNGEWGGRVKQVILEGVDGAGSATSVTTTGAGIYNARTWPAYSDGLRSSWWQITTTMDASIVSQSAAPTLVRPPGEPSTGSLTVTLKNTGTAVWPTDGLHLAVASPPGQADALVGDSTRPGVLVPTAATSIGPGETASFTLALDSRAVAAGNHGRAYRLRIADGPVFGATVNWTIPVVAATFTAVPAAKPAATATPTADAPPSVFADGRTVVVPRNGSTGVRLQARNTGNVTWPAAPDTNVVLGTSGPRERDSLSAGDTWLSAKRPARLSETSPVAPGSIGSFLLTLYGAGQQVGVTTESFEPAWEGRHWIDGALTTLSVVRVDPAVSRLAALEKAPPLTGRLSTTTSGATLVVRLRNLGGSTWAVGKEWLATTSGKADPLRTSAWPYPTRPPAMAGNVTRPGVGVVYPGEVGEWRIPLSGYRKPPGTYAEAWQPLGPTGRYGPVLKTSVTVVRG
ncbi:MAG: stage sporulation protein [Actinomycetota bacterium]|jgi:SpoIID/LytB domain protein|nr:stage sporulation protein [Actinomycetota bacterium]